MLNSVFLFHTCRRTTPSTEISSGNHSVYIAKEISFDKPAKEDVEVPADCQRTTMEEFQVIMEEMQEGLMPEEDLDLEEDE